MVIKKHKEKIDSPEWGSPCKASVKVLGGDFKKGYE
jgi:hypothetical protein